MLSVTIVKISTGNPVKHARVAIGIDAFLGGGVTKSQYTDAKGQVHFPNLKPCKGEVFVDGRSKYKGRLEGNTYIYV